MIRPALTAGFLLAAFSFGLFFTGYRDIIYAPAVLCVLLAACVAVIPSFWRVCHVPSGAAPFLLFAFWLYITASLLWSSVPFASMVTWLVFISLPVTFFALSAPQDSRRYIVTAAGAMLGALAILGSWALLQSTLLRNVYGMRAHHPLPNANDLAALLNLGLFPVLAILLGRREGRGILFYVAAAAAALIFGGLLATQSRSGLLFFLAALVILLAVLRPALKTGASVLGVGAVIFALMLFESGWKFAARLAQLAAPSQDPNILSRFSLWESTLRMMRDHPWGGTGLGTFYLYYPRYRAPLVENSAGFWAHSDPLQLGAEVGIAATVIFYAFFAAVLWRTVSALRSSERGSEGRVATAGFSCALLTLALHAHAGFPLYIMPVLIVAGVWLAAWHNFTAACGSAHGGGYIALDVANWQRPVLALCVACVGGLAALMAGSSAAGQYYLLRATNDIKHAQVTGFIDNIGRAERWAPPAFIDPEVQLAGFYIDTIGAATILFPAEEKEKMFADGMALLALAESMNPAWAEIDYKRGKLFETAEDAEGAVASWRTALAKNPMHARARASLAKALIGQGRPAEAYDLLAVGLDYPHGAEATLEFDALMKNIEGVAAMQKSFLQKDEAQ